MSISQESPDQAAVDEADELRADIINTRAELADTLDQLMAKADVKARARGQLTDLMHRARTHRTQLAIAAAALLSVAVVVVIRRR